MPESREATDKKTRGLRKSPPTRRLPMRWGELPHQELYQRALNAMALGSRERAGEDSLKNVLKHRLPDLDYDDHRRYIEIECCKIVEMLRVVRDEYRRYLEKEGCKPIAEVYWVVYRFGVIRYAVRLLREVASEYVDNTKVPFVQWEILYGSCFLPTFTIAGDLSVPESPKTPSLESVKDVIQGLIREETFEHVLDGGPFGREGQLYLTRQNPSFDFWGHGVDLFEIVEKRQVLWEDCKPWTAGLAHLFDNTQEEVNFEWSLLGQDAKRVESAFTKLSAFEKIAYEHLIDMRRNSRISRNLGESDWLKVLETLDKGGIALDAEFTDIPKKILEAVRRRGHQITTWKECYQSKQHVTMDNGKTYSLRREVTHAVHNAAKKAAYQRAKVWKFKE
jgi:hypothetical protein